MLNESYNVKLHEKKLMLENVLLALVCELLIVYVKKVYIFIFAVLLDEFQKI